MQISTVPLTDYGHRKFDRNRFVRIPETFGRISEKKRVSVTVMGKYSKFDGLNNGVMLRFPPGSSVTVRVRPHNVLGVEQEVGVAESKKWVAAIFLLPVWPLAPYGQAFSSFFAVYSRHFACGGSGISLRYQAR